MPRLRRNEWNFAAIIAARISELLSEPEFSSSRLGHAEPELGELRGARRLDLVIFDRVTPTLPLITGELKVPWQVEGRTPYASNLVEGAHSKASRVGARYFITWNIRRLVVWKTDDPGVALDQRVVFDREILRAPAVVAEDLDKAEVRQALNSGLSDLLRFLSSALEGAPEPSFLPLDRLFIARLESALDFPIEATVDSLARRMGADPMFRGRCERWMREDQGWIVSRATESENLERAARFTSYVLVNRLCFYNALRRKYQQLPRITVANNIASGAMLARRLRDSFNDATRFTGDYETVFDEDFGDSVPFLSDQAVAGWRLLIRSLDRYDFSTLSLDVVGSMYEQLISPDERHRYGQHYTQPAVVDLINAFAIDSADATVLDPACGGGTFLVRAYARKQSKNPTRTHSQLLEKLFGCDVLQYACHLSVINLAVRDLIDDDNFPRVHCGDFLTFESGTTFFDQPVRLQAGGLVTDHNPINLPARSCDAVVGNPPYISARVMTPDQRAEYVRIARHEWPDYEWSAFSDIYCHFWTHATTFLKERGVLGFITQAAWLDVEYGIPVQLWMLNNFKIVAVFESEVEPWFTDARVATVVTILRRESDPVARSENKVKFVQFGQRLIDFADRNATEAQRQKVAETIRDAILAVETDVQIPGFRVRCIDQEQLHATGLSRERYEGSSWGRYLRSIDSLNELQRDYSKRFVVLDELAQLRRGITTNCDDFFIVDDATDDAIAKFTTATAFRDHFGVQLRSAQEGALAIVRRSDGVEMPLERQYLRRILRTARNVASYSTSQLDDSSMVVLLPEDRRALSDLGRQYVRAGEREHWHESASFRGVVASGGSWFSLREADPSAILFVKTMQYSPFVIWNDAGRIANQRLYEIRPRDGVAAEALCAVLNSTILAAERYASVKALGREAAIDVEVFTARRFRVPDLRTASEHWLGRVTRLFEILRNRPATPMLEVGLREARLPDALRYASATTIDRRVWPEEFLDPIRQELDTRVLELLGVPVAEVERVRERMYNELLGHTRKLRLLELEAQQNRQGVWASGPSPRALAQEMLTATNAAIRPIPSDFVPATAARINLPAGRVTIVAQTLFDEGKFACRIGETTLTFDNESQRDYVVFIAGCGANGDLPMPSPDDCPAILHEMQAYYFDLRTRLEQAAADVTSNRDLAGRIVTEALRHLVRQ